MEDMKEYTPEEIAVLEEKAAKFDKSRKMRKRLLIGGGVFAGMFLASTIAKLTEKETTEESVDEEADEVIVDDTVKIEINDSSVDIISSEDIATEEN